MYGSSRTHTVGLRSGLVCVPFTRSTRALRSRLRCLHGLFTFVTTLRFTVVYLLLRSGLRSFRLRDRLRWFGHLRLHTSHAFAVDAPAHAGLRARLPVWHAFTFYAVLPFSCLHHAVLASFSWFAFSRHLVPMHTSLLTRCLVMRSWSFGTFRFHSFRIVFCWFTRGFHALNRRFLTHTFQHYRLPGCTLLLHLPFYARGSRSFGYCAGYRLQRYWVGSSSGSAHTLVYTAFSAWFARCVLASFYVPGCLARCFLSFSPRAHLPLRLHFLVYTARLRAHTTTARAPVRFHFSLHCLTPFHARLREPLHRTVRFYTLRSFVAFGLRYTFTFAVLDLTRYLFYRLLDSTVEYFAIRWLRFVVVVLYALRRFTSPATSHGLRLFYGSSLHGYHTMVRLRFQFAFSHRSARHALSFGCGSLLRTSWFAVSSFALIVYASRLSLHTRFHALTHTFLTRYTFHTAHMVSLV